jgi:serine/threonine-protein kinase RsbT
MVAGNARVERSEDLSLRSGEDVVRLRQAVRERAVSVGFSLVDQTKIVTAASEIGRNTVQYGGGGTARISIIANGTRRGLRLDFMDEGPGIPDIAQALQDGFTTGGGLGLGLSGAKRLCDEFDVQSEVGKGTRIALVRWKPY